MNLSGGFLKKKRSCKNKVNKCESERDWNKKQQEVLTEKGIGGHSALCSSLVVHCYCVGVLYVHPYVSWVQQNTGGMI